MVDDGVDEGAELARVAKGAFADGVEDGLQGGVELETAVPVSVAQVFDVFGEVAEEEDVVFADFARNFDVGAVTGANDKAAVEDELDASYQLGNLYVVRGLLHTFMLLVPEASVPAVEICSLISLAGTMISALLTL